MPSGDVFKINLLMNWGSVECRPGFHLIEGTGGSSTDPMLNAAQAVLDALGPGPLAGFSDQCFIHGIQVVDAQPGLRPTTNFPMTPIPGDVVDANPLPPQSAAVLSFTTGVKGSVGVYATHARIYMPGIPQNGQISGFLQATFQAALEAFGNLLAAPFIDDGTNYQMNSVSYTPASRPRTIRAVNPILGFNVNNVVRSQRRREYGVGI